MNVLHKLEDKETRPETTDGLLSPRDILGPREQEQAEQERGRGHTTPSLAGRMMPPADPPSGVPTAGSGAPPGLLRASPFSPSLRAASGTTTAADAT